MNFSERFIKPFRLLLPAPFTIAVTLTIVTFIIAFFATIPEREGSGAYSFLLLKNWESGLWSEKYIVFAFQMMLMLVLGHVLALTRPVNWFIDKIVVHCSSTAKAALIVTLCTISVSFLNWGLGLIFGAILARKVGEHASKTKAAINYAIIGAAGYSGLMVWHGGLSGSAPLKVNEAGHFLQSEIGIISMKDTVLSSPNMLVWLILLIVLPLSMYLLGKKSGGAIPELKAYTPAIETDSDKSIGAEKLNNSSIYALLFSGILVVYMLYKVFFEPENISWKSILSHLNPNEINLALFALAIALHGNFKRFLDGVSQAISGASGILIQFPLYFGIMGIMAGSGLTDLMSSYFAKNSSESSFPLLTLISSGIVNIFVPSGGGQWTVQGKIIVDAAAQLNVSVPKSIMALAYGDQLTNMLQPFWALPLLGITGLKAKDILPYALYLMLIGGIIFTTGILFIY